MSGNAFTFSVISISAILSKRIAKRFEQALIALWFCNQGFYILHSIIEYHLSRKIN